MTDNEVLKFYSKINPYNNNGLGKDNFRKNIGIGKNNRNKYSYYIPGFLLKNKKRFLDNECYWVSSNAGNSFKDEINLQLYYDLIVLGIDDISKRPKCKYCKKEAFFIKGGRNILPGYADHCYEHHELSGHDKLKGREVSQKQREITRNRFKGIPLTEEHKKKLSLAKKGKILTEEQRLKRPRGYHFKMSKESILKSLNSRMKNGNFHSRNYYKTGKIYSNKLSNKGGEIKFLSSYEEDFIKICNVNKFIKEINIPKFIRYKLNKEEHLYYPDFLITLDNNQKVLVEIKAFDLLNDKKVIMKKLYAKKWCRENKINYITLTEKDIYINHLGKQFINKNLYPYKYLYKNYN